MTSFFLNFIWLFDYLTVKLLFYQKNIHFSINALKLFYDKILPLIPWGLWIFWSVFFHIMFPF